MERPHETDDLITEHHCTRATLPAYEQRRRLGRAKPARVTGVRRRQDAIGATYQAIAATIDQCRNPPPSQLVDVNGEQMHSNCVGEATTGYPTVILEQGLGGASLAWGWIQAEVTRTT